MDTGDAAKKASQTKYWVAASAMVLGLAMFWLGGSASFDWAEAGSGSGAKPWSFWVMVFGGLGTAAGFIYSLYLASDAVVRRDRTRTYSLTGSAT